MKGGNLLHTAVLRTPAITEGQTPHQDALNTREICNSKWHLMRVLKGSIIASY